MFVDINKIIYKLYILLFIIFTIHFTSLAQENSQIDSLTQLYKKTIDQTVKQNALKALSNIYGDKGDWFKYQEVMEQMLLLQEEKQDSFYLAETYNKLGISCSRRGKTPEALTYFQKALEINLAQNNILIAANSYENIGVVYKDMGDYSNAVDYQIKSLEIRKERKHPRLLNNYMKLATLQGLLGNVEKEDYYLRLAKSEMQDIDSITPRNKALFYNQLGHVYNQRNKLDSSIICYKNVILYSKQIEWKVGIAVGLGNLADLYSETGALDSSIFYHRQSLKLSGEINDCLSITDEFLSIAKLFEKVDKNDSVLFYANNSLLKARECDLLYQQNTALKFIAEYHSRQHRFEEAYVFLQQHYKLEDSISSADVRNNIANLETKYETKVKEQQIEILTTENKLKNQRIKAVIILLVVLITVIILILYILQIQKKQAILKQNDLQQQVLRAQMNPHFIFNVLGSIQNFMLNNDTKKAAGYLANFASLTRSTLENSASDTISLHEEVTMLRNYMELEKMRVPNKFNFEIEMDEAIESEFIRIPPMLIQPFIENAIKHGFRKLDKPGKLNLKISDKGDAVEFIIEDNGIGLTSNESSSENHQSMAINIFSERRKLIKQRHKKEFNFEILDRHEVNPVLSGVLIKVRVPILEA
ncbi:MAG: tetratricopeptide repeat protein [Prolixibacteraceae bacterium]|nr:tetratricopeptide repeat protein [Prolixibacteraceae bacterium]